MTSERIQRQIERLLDEADEAASRNDWEAVRARADAALAFDPDSLDAKAYLEAAMRRLAQVLFEDRGIRPAAVEEHPTSFAGGRYEVRRFLGEGGKKRVYLAHDTRLDRDVAFALIKSEGLDDEARERITREAQAMGRLGDHPNVVTVFDSDTENGQAYLVLPLLEGGAVDDALAAAPEHRLPLERVVEIGAEVCFGLEFAHAKGIIHRDIKPSNVWLTSDGRAKIGDFGLAVAQDRSRLTQAGMMVGTPTYMPPEQAMGGDVGARSDLYSLGAMLYEMVCGRPPFVGDDYVAVVSQHLNTPPVAPSWHRPDCPPGLEALILRLLEKDPSKRPASAEEVRSTLVDISTAGSASHYSDLQGADALLAVPHASEPLYRSVFVGREHELRELQTAFDAAVSGEGSLVMVVGEPGIGKTALCEQLATYVALRGGKTLIGHSYEEGSLSLPYLAFVEALRSYVLAREPDGLRSDLGTGAADVARIVSEIRDRVEVELRPAGDPEDDRWRLLQAVTGFLRNASAVQPLLIVLEDLHWADRGTLDLLLHLARNLRAAGSMERRPRLMVVGTYRDVEIDRSHPLSAALADLRRVGGLPRVLLRGLTINEVHRMYSAIRGNDVAWTAAEAVYRQTEGNPLFVQEIARYMVEEGLVVREGGRYVPQVATGLTLPDGLRDVVGRRLSNLGEKTNQVLSFAAVNGRDFRLDVLQLVSGLTEDEVIGALEEAKQRAIIEERPIAGAFGFRFTHALFRQTLYEEIFAPRRIRLHQQVGRALEEVYARRLDEHAAELAEHFAQSTEALDLEKAVRYGELAAQRAMQVYAYGEAVRHLEQALRALEVLDPDEKVRRCDLLLSLGEAMLPLGDPKTVSEVVSPEAFSLAERLDDSLRASRACVLALEAVQRGFGGSGDEHDWTERLDRTAPAGSPFRVYADIAKSRQLNSRPQKTALLEPAFRLAHELADRNLVFHAGWEYIFAQTTPENWRGALMVADELERTPRSGVHSRHLARFLIFGSQLRMVSGDRAAWEKNAAELSALAGRTNDANVVLSARWLESYRPILDGRLEEAFNLGKASVDFGRERAIATTPVAVVASLACGYLGNQEYGDLFDNDARRFEVKRNLLACEMRELGAQALNEIEVDVESRGQMDDQTLVDLSSEHVDANSVSLVAATKLRSKVPARQLLDLVEHAGNPFAIRGFSQRRLCGAAAATLGEQDRARLNYAQAIEDCTKLRHRPEMALSRLLLAELLLEHYPNERDAAIDHLDFAISEFREMKMQPSLERALRHRGLLKA